MIVAPPASGKGVMNDAKHLFSAIEKQRRDMYKTFTIPGNISAAMLIQMISANEGSGIFIHTSSSLHKTVSVSSGFKHPNTKRIFTVVNSF